ncbi:endolytic transglycosylase MltG [Bacillus sp. JCM 19034]|uniref:endolytic transglycosylase MltG n=1 Tax=Bacillus sp. JCM 19034 TaxID=1481928 RepID=UPI00078292E9|nr:endolytic transglycosylase MltG [Bacillus sp. JCM 19034]
MPSSGLQQFAGGLFLATALIGGALYFTNEQEDTSEGSGETKKPMMATVDLIERLENENYVVLDAEEFASLQTQLEEAGENNTDEDELNEATYVMILQISAGMTSNDVAKHLELGQIIENEQDFLSYVATNQLSHRLKTGQYEVTSEMSIEEIVELIT